MNENRFLENFSKVVERAPDLDLITKKPTEEPDFENAIFEVESFARASFEPFLFYSDKNEQVREEERQAGISKSKERKKRNHRRKSHFPLWSSFHRERIHDKNEKENDLRKIEDRENEEELLCLRGAYQEEIKDLFAQDEAKYKEVQSFQEKEQTREGVYYSRLFDLEIDGDSFAPRVGERALAFFTELDKNSKIVLKMRKENGELKLGLDTIFQAGENEDFYISLSQFQEIYPFANGDLELSLNFLAKKFGLEFEKRERGRGKNLKTNWNLPVDRRPNRRGVGGRFAA